MVDFSLIVLFWWLVWWKAVKCLLVITYLFCLKYVSCCDLGFVLCLLLLLFSGRFGGCNSVVIVLLEFVCMVLRRFVYC